VSALVPRWGVLCGVAALALGLRASPPSEADTEVAQALLQSAKNAHDKKQYDEALTLLAKAAQEAPDLRETQYWVGSCYDKKGDAPAAVRAWREFRDAIAASPPGPPASKGELELLRKAQVRLSVLAPGEAEEDKLRKAFAADLWALAKAKEQKDPASALLVLDTLLLAEPRHLEAVAAAARLRTPPPRKGEFPLPPPLATLTAWNDVIAAEGLGVGGAWTYANHVLTLDIDDNSIPGPPVPMRVGNRCALDMELRVLNTIVPTWSVGFALMDETQPRMVGIAVEAKEVSAFRGPTAGPMLKITSSPIAPIELNTWHRLSVQVAAPKIVVWVDGKKAAQLATDDLGPGTHLRLYMNRCKVEMRTLRWARME
jgi:hypothetical protein